MVTGTISKVVDERLPLSRGGGCKEHAKCYWQPADNLVDQTGRWKRWGGCWCWLAGFASAKRASYLAWNERICWDLSFFFISFIPIWYNFHCKFLSILIFTLFISLQIISKWNHIQCYIKYLEKVRRLLMLIGWFRFCE